jgi:hypothetical protein
MADRVNSPAYAALPRSTRKVFAAIQRAIGDGSSASVSYLDFRLDHHKGPAQPSPTLGDAINAGFGYLELKCLGCNTHHGLTRRCNLRSLGWVIVVTAATGSDI